MGILSELELATIRQQVETHPRMRTLAEALTRRGLNRVEANHLLEGILLRVLEDAGGLYQKTLRGRLEHLAHLRDQVSTIIEDVVNGRTPPAANVKENTAALFADLQREMDALESPSKQVQREGVKVNDDVVARARAELRTLAPEQQRVQSQILQGLDADSRTRVNVAAERAPAATRRAVFAETETGLAAALNEVRTQLQGAEVSPAEIDATLDSLSEMNNRLRAAQRDPITLQGATEALARARALARLKDPALMQAISRSKILQRLAAENPKMLADLWAKYKSSSSGATLRDYVVEVIMKRHIVGLRGELVATFQLGDALTLLKSPDLEVTIPGTDMVGVADLTGDIWLIDNKALSAEELATVNALTHNLSGNIAADVAEFQQALAGSAHQGRVIDPHIQNAVERLGRASQDLQNLGLTPENVNTPEMQREIARILDRYRIRRVVTNVGGQVSGLRPGLSNIHIELEDLR